MAEEDDVVEEEESTEDDKAEENGGYQPKISDTEAVFLILFGLLLDIADWLFADIPVANILGFPVIQIYLRWKGLTANYMLIINILKFAPFADLLPTRTIGLAFLVAEDRNPKLGADVEKVAKLKQWPGAAGGAAAEAGGAAQAAASARQPHLPAAGERPRMINAAETTASPPEFRPEDYNLPAAPMTEVQESLFERPVTPPRPAVRGEADILNTEESAAGRAAEEKKDMELEERLDTGLARLERLRRGEYEEDGEADEFKKAA